MQLVSSSDTCLCSEMMSFPSFALSTPQLISLRAFSAGISVCLLLRQIGGYIQRLKVVFSSFKMSGTLFAVFNEASKVLF